MVLELFCDLQSCLLWKILSEKVKHVSVAQLVHEILLKVSKIYFFNFHDFVSFFTNFFHLNILISKNMFLEVFSLTIAFIRIRKVKISVDWSFLLSKILFSVILGPQLIWNLMVQHKTPRLWLQESLLTQRISWVP